MGQGPSTPSSDSSINLVFATESLSNNTIKCDELGIRYRIHTPSVFGDRITSIHRWDNETQKEMLIAEMEKQSFSSQRIRIAPGIGLDAVGPSVPFVPVSKFFPSTGGWSRK